MKYIYIGYSHNLKMRIEDHLHGEVKTTSEYVNSELIWYCAFNDKGQALAFEKYLKAGSGHALARKRLI